MMFVLWIHGYVISTRGLAEIQNISYYKARKYCKELEKEGFDVNENILLKELITEMM